MNSKRTVVLSSVNGKVHKAVLSLTKEDGEIVGSLRLYNFKSKPEGVLTLGILSGGKVFKAGLNEKNGIYEFRAEVDGNLEEFTCALVNSVRGEIVPLLIGSSDGKASSSQEEALASSLGVLDKSKLSEVKEELDKNGIELEEDIEKTVDEALKCENCMLCPYKDAFYENEVSVASEEAKPEEPKEKPEPDGQNEPESIQHENKFYSKVKNQLDDLFKKHDPEEVLAEIIPNSKWIKIDYDGGDSYYVVGLIYEDEKVKYICYGIPGLWSKECPEELDGYAQWLPLDEENAFGEGYWISYQDAENGDNVEIEII